MHVCVCVCVRERERERESECVCVFWWRCVLFFVYGVHWHSSVRVRGCAGGRECVGACINDMTSLFTFKVHKMHACV